MSLTGVGAQWPCLHEGDDSIDGGLVAIHLPVSTDEEFPWGGHGEGFVG